MEQSESTIHLLSPTLETPKVDIPCSVLEIKGRRLQLKSKELVPARVPLSVEHDDALYLGEVVRCVLEGMYYTVDIEVEQVLTGLQSLVSLRARLLDEQAASARPKNSEKSDADEVSFVARRQAQRPWGDRHHGEDQYRPKD